LSTPWPARVPRLGEANAILIERTYLCLRDCGYEDGNIRVEWRFANGRAERFPALATELAVLPVDVLMTSRSAGARAGKEATRTTPIVIAGCNDALGLAIVDSLARPGINVTGLTTPELMAKRLELFKGLFRRLARSVSSRSGTPSRVQSSESAESRRTPLGPS